MQDDSTVSESNERNPFNSPTDLVLSINRTGFGQAGEEQHVQLLALGNENLVYLLGGALWVENDRLVPLGGGERDRWGRWGRKGKETMEDRFHKEMSKQD